MRVKSANPVKMRKSGRKGQKVRPDFQWKFSLTSYIASNLQLHQHNLTSHPYAHFLLYALLHFSLNAKVLPEAGVTVTSYNIQLPTVHIA